MCAAKDSVLPLGRVDGKHRHLCVVKAVESQGLAVGAPPEGTVLGRTAENFFVIDPAGETVHNSFGAVEGESLFRPAGDVHHPEVVAAGESKFGRVRREGEVYGALRLQWEVGILFRSLEALGTDGFVAFQREFEGILIGEGTVVAECYLFVVQPFIGCGDGLEPVLGPDGRLCCYQQSQRQDKVRCFHDPKGTKFFVKSIRFPGSKAQIVTLRAESVL